MKTLLLSLLLVPFIAFSQEADPTPPLVVDPAMNPPEANPADPDAPDSSANPVSPNVTGGPDEKISLNYPDTQIVQILLLYEQLSGKRLIRDANLAGQNMSINVFEPVTKREAVSIIEATLLLNNYALVPYGKNQVKVLNIVTGKNPRSEGTRIFASPASLPAGDQVISYYMSFKYIDSQEAYNTMSQHVMPHPYGFFIRIPSTQALLITENTSVIRELIALKELIDVPPASILSEFVPLMRADAERVAETITKMIEAQKSGQSSSGQTPGAPPPPPNPDPNNGGQPVAAVFSTSGLDSSPNNLVSGQVQLVPDTRTNRILVISRPSSFPYVKSLIQAFDQAVGLTDPLEMPLKYISAGEILPVLADLLAEDTKDNSGANGIQTPSGQPSSGQTRNLNGGGLGGDGGGASLSRPDSLDEPDQDAGPESRIVGKTRIIADKKANKILVIGPPESLEKCRNIIDRLDKKPQQVYLSTVIGQLKLTDNNELGVDFLQRFLGNDSGVAGGSITSSAAAAFLPRTLVDATKTPLTAGLGIYGTIGDSLSYYIRALESTNRFKVLSRPVVYAANNKKAVISSGQRIAVPRETLSDNTNSNDNSTAVRSSIDYEEVVLKLEVIPLINADNEVTLKVAQINDSVIGNQTISGERVPTIGTQEVRTTVTVANKHVVVLGGLITESKTNDKTGVPVLSNIPLLGYFFRSTKDNTERNELLIFIQPNVVGTNADIRRESSIEELRTDVAPSAREMAEPPVPDVTPVPKLKSFNK